MHVIDVRNVHEALPEGIAYLLREGQERETRNGPVLVAPGPITTLYRNPRERVLFWAARDANPFLHFFESLWMLDGRNDVAYLAQFVPSMRKFSDDGVTFHGAYGARWRNWFSADDELDPYPKMDQLLSIINILRRNPDDRRCVLQMWDASADLGLDGRDLPCNTQAYFSINVAGELDMTVCNRSNDVIWGAYGTNAVHFSFLQEFMASALVRRVGRYWQMSNNYHAYRSTLDPIRSLGDMARDPHRERHNPYNHHQMYVHDLMKLPAEAWLGELRMFVEEGVVLGLRDPFFRKVAAPMLEAHTIYKTGTGVERYTGAMEALKRCEAPDWHMACRQWLQRRMEKYNAKIDAG